MIFHEGSPIRFVDLQDTADYIHHPDIRVWFPDGGLYQVSDTALVGPAQMRVTGFRPPDTRQPRPGRRMGFRGLRASFLASPLEQVPVMIPFAEPDDE